MTHNITDQTPEQTSLYWRGYEDGRKTAAYAEQFRIERDKAYIRIAELEQEKNIILKGRMNDEDCRQR